MDAELWPKRVGVVWATICVSVLSIRFLIMLHRLSFSGQPPGSVVGVEISADDGSATEAKKCFHIGECADNSRWDANLNPKQLGSINSEVDEGGGRRYLPVRFLEHFSTVHPALREMGSQ
ncbi:hypothetical protein TNCV_4817661 [Trichonephila clavipes]|nr:hypothetical protein TNCV_4817661 [Trichonephila clavipes]